MVDRIGFLEIPRRRVTGIAIPAIRIHCGMHRINWMALGKEDRIVVGTDVASTATCGVGGMDRIHKQRCCGISTRARAIDARTIEGRSMTRAAIRRCGNVTCRFRDHEGCVVSLTIVATAAIVGNTCRRMVEGRHCEITVTGAVTDQTIRPARCRRWHVRQ